MRLIDADTLIVDIMDHGVDHVQTDDLDEINQIINDAPTVDAAPVVRCGNCKYGRESNNFKGYFYCDKPFFPKGVAHNFNWYCPGGERKEDMT